MCTEKAYDLKDEKTDGVTDTWAYRGRRLMKEMSGERNSGKVDESLRNG